MGAMAKTLVRAFGRAATIERPGTTSYDPTTGTASATGALSVACEVTLTNFEERQVDGTLVQEGDRKAMVSRLRLEDDGGAGFVPVPSVDALVEGGRTWKIVGVLGISSGDEEAMFILHVRR